MASSDQPEPLLSPEEKRLTIEPIRYKDLWGFYKKHEAAIWHAHEVPLTEDLALWGKLNENEQYFIKMVLAFFASSDMIVAENLASRFMREIQVTEARVFYGFQLMMENIHCVAPETMILTDEGYFPICNLVGQNIKVWNGYEYSQTIVRQTSNVPTKLLKIKLSNGAELDATPDHKWVIKGVDDRKMTKDLVSGDIITTYRLPIVYNGITIQNPYTKGSEFAVDNSIRDEENTSIVFNDVPLTANISCRLNWFAGYLDINLYRNIERQNNEGYHIYDTLPILRKIQLLIQTFGLKSNISEDVLVDDDGGVLKKYCISLSKYDISHLKRIGFATKIFKLSTTGNISIPIDNEVSIVDVSDENREALTYCFNEPVNHTGIFNGILTGQSEVYSNLINAYVKDQSEKEKLFNAISTIPSVAKKAEWAMKWIENTDRFATRLVAFAAVEGIFFSGSFCAIFWIREKGLLPGLTKSNDFIARDEGMHTDFACHLYRVYVVNKLSKEEFTKLITEAVDIEVEFITTSLPCRLVGMNSTMMIEYIKFVANRIAKQLGHEEVYPGAKQPFTFMDRILLKSKTNFFEGAVTEYGKNQEVEEDPFANI